MRFYYLKDNMKIEAAAIDACRNRIVSLSMSKYFSNGRTIRRFYDFLVEQVEERVSECEINNKQINTILVSDIPSLDKAMRVLNL